MIKRFFGCIFFSLFFGVIGFSASAQQSRLTYKHFNQPPTVRELMRWHEVLTYEVHYSFFKLGEVKVEIVGDTLYNGQKSWHLQSIITSNSSVPFVGEEENHYNSIFRVIGDMFQVQQFWSDNVDENEFKDSQYIFDREKNQVYAHKLDEPDDTLALEEPASSGHIILFANRLAAGTDSLVKIPVYLNQEKKYLTLANTTKLEKRTYDAFPHKVQTYYAKGDTDINGPFGFSGKFDAWYLADDLRVPLEARVKVWLGHVKVKLIDYKKELR